MAGADPRASVLRMGIAGQGRVERSWIVLEACALLALAAVPVAACGGGSDDDGVGGDDAADDGGEVQPCDLADAEMVASVFDGTVAPGEPGSARNCSFEVSGGEVQSVDVYYYGPADDWDGVRSGFDQNRGGTTDVSGIGEAAFFPNDRGARELVVRTDELIFSITVFVFEPPPGIEDDVAALAQAIVDAS